MSMVLKQLVLLMNTILHRQNADDSSNTHYLGYIGAYGYDLDWICHRSISLTDYNLDLIFWIY